MGWVTALTPTARSDGDTITITIRRSEAHALMRAANTVHLLRDGLGIAPPDRDLIGAARTLHTTLNPPE